MKKALSVLLALSLLLCCVPALAEEAAEYAPYTDPTGHYSLEYSSNFLFFDSNNVNVWVDAVTKAESEGETLPDAFHSFINMVLEDEGPTIFIDIHTGSIIYIWLSVADSPVDAAIVPSYLSAIKEHWGSKYPDAVIDDEGSVLSSIDGTEFSHVGMYYLQSTDTLLKKIEREEEYVACVGNVLYEIIITRSEGCNTEEIAHMLSSFSSTAE